MIQAIAYVGDPATLPIIKLRAKPQIRTRNGFDETSLAELAATIKEVGVIEPLIVRRDPTDPETYIVIAGERRLLAASMAGHTEVPVLIRDASDSQAATLQAIENLQRENLSLADTADGVAALLKHYKTPKEVCKALGKSPAWVSKHLSMTRLTDVVKTVLLTGITEDAELLLCLDQVARTKGEAAQATLERLLDGLEQGTTTRTTARAALAALKAPTPDGEPAGEEAGEGEGKGNATPVSAKLKLSASLAHEILHALKFTAAHDSPRGLTNAAIEAVERLMTENGWKA
jgi:ParB family chromosome partitioning protein